MPAARSADLRTATRRTDAHGRHVATAARSLHPAGAEATSGAGCWTACRCSRTSPAEPASAARAVSRNDRRAARKHGDGVLFGLVFGVLIPLSAGTGEAGISQAML
jgi:hypothetical protein